MTGKIGEKTMEFSWSAFNTLFAAGVCFTGLGSLFEGTFWSDSGQKVNVPYVWHWGIGPCCALFSVVAGFIAPVLMKSPIPFGGDPLTFYGRIALISLVITALLFRMWRPNENRDDCPIQIKEKGVTIAGCIFFTVFATFMTILIAYALTPAPRNVVIRVGEWLVPWPFLGTLAVNWRVNRGRDKNDPDAIQSERMAWAITIGLEVLIIVVTFAKL